MQSQEFELPATLNKNNVASILKTIDDKLKQSPLNINCNHIASIDAAGIALLTYLTGINYKSKIKLNNINSNILELCQLYHITL